MHLFIDRYIKIHIYISTSFNLSLSLYIYIYIQICIYIYLHLNSQIYILCTSTFLHQPIGIMVRVITNGPEDMGSITS